MSPEQLQQFEEMKRTIEQLRTVTDVSFIAELRRRLNSGTVSVTTGASATGTAQLVRNSTNTGTETVADQYTSVATLTINGTVIGRIGIY